MIEQVGRFSGLQLRIGVVVCAEGKWTRITVHLPSTSVLVLQLWYNLIEFTEKYLHYLFINEWIELGVICAVAIWFARTGFRIVRI
jgi:hypothetical protein